MLAAVRQIVNASIRPIGFEVSRVERPLPERRQIDIFGLCFKDLLARKPKPSVLQIGANDGVSFDPVHDLIVEHGLPAVLVEPHPVAFEKLKLTYAGCPSVKTRNAAIAERDGKLPFYVPSPELADQPRLNQLSSFDRAQLLQALTGTGVESAADKISTIQVEAKTVPSLLREEGISQIDILQIDTECFDWKILSQFDLRALDVQLINIEFFALRRDEQIACIEKLSSLGYATSQFLGDLIAYRA